MDLKNETVVSPEEITADQEALQEAKEDEVRSKVITEYGFDEVEDAERIEKLTKERLGTHQMKKSLTGQKIKWRNEANKPKEPTQTPAEAPKVVTEDVSKVVAEQLDQRTLEELDYPEDLKKEIGRIAKTNNSSIKAALKDPYIAFKIDEHEKSVKTDEAAISRNNRSGSKKGYSMDTPPDVDMATAEGRAEWEKYKDWMKKQ